MSPREGVSRLRSALSATEDEADQAVALVEESLARALADPAERDLFLLAFVEALNNAVEHGSRRDPGKKIQLAGLFRQGLALLFLEDQGEGYSPSFPQLTQVEGRRGRGLGFMKRFSDQVLFNLTGNQVALWKGCAGMVKELKFSTAKINALPEKVVVVSEFIPRGKTFEAVGELLDMVQDTGWKRLFLNLSEIKLLTSTVWGSVFAETKREEAELLVLFNCAPSIVASAQAMGIENRQDSYAKIVAAPDFREPFLLLCQSLEQGQQD